MPEEQTAPVSVVTRWLDILARGAIAEWPQVTDDDLVMQVVFMPGGGDPVSGREANAAIVSEFWKSWKTFVFHDVEAHGTDDGSGLVFVTARSEAETVWGAPYANTYVFRTRVRDGKVVEHREYFNPLPVMEAFKDYLPA